MMEKEKIAVENQYKNLCEKLFPLIEPDQQELINKAFLFAYKAHQGASRLSEAPYITHSINVAHTIAIEMRKVKLDPICIAVALLHDVLEDTNTSLKMLEQNFGKKVAMMVDGLTKISHDSATYYSEKLKSLRKLLRAAISEIQIILIKIADRLDNMRSIDFLPRTRQLYIASETKEVYTKIASLLGLVKIKKEMDDLCFKTMYPKKYYNLSRLLKEHSNQRTVEINEFLKIIEPALKAHDIPCSIEIRSKSISSIHHKMSKKCVSFHEIYDLIGIRIIIPNKNERLNCWRIYGIITSFYHTDRKRTKDWITKPSEEYGYESLHITIVGGKGASIEVQIRTERMHEIATEGSAAHWKYKEKNLADVFNNLDEWSKNALDKTLDRYGKLKTRLLQQHHPIQINSERLA